MRGKGDVFKKLSALYTGFSTEIYKQREVFHRGGKGGGEGVEGEGKGCENGVVKTKESPHGLCCLLVQNRTAKNEIYKFSQKFLVAEGNK